MVPSPDSPLNPGQRMVMFGILPEHGFEGVSFWQFHNTEDSDKARHTKYGNARATEWIKNNNWDIDKDLIQLHHL